MLPVCTRHCGLEGGVAARLNIRIRGKDGAGRRRWWHVERDAGGGDGKGNTARNLLRAPTCTFRTPSSRQ